LRGLTNILWDEANLTRWHPLWQRDWGRTRYELLKAAAHIHVKSGEPLANHLFVPRPYREADKGILNEEFNRFLARLATRGPGVARAGIIIAPVRRVKKTGPTTGVFHLRHLRLPIGMTESMMTFLSQQCRSAYRRIWLNEDPNRLERAPGWKEDKHPEVMAVLHVELNSRNGLWCRGAWLMQVHPSVFIPTNSGDEVRLVDALIREKHQFQRVLAGSLSSQATPEWIVRHVVGPDGVHVQRASLIITNNGADATHLSKRAALAEMFASKGVPTWTWVPVGRQADHVVPALPPTQNASPGEVMRDLERIHSGAGVTYLYGSRFDNRR
jgi:hypothetical protein